MKKLMTKSKTISIAILLWSVFCLLPLSPNGLYAYELVDDEAATAVGTPVTIDVTANDTLTLGVVFSRDGEENMVCFENAQGEFDCRNSAPIPTTAGKWPWGTSTAMDIWTWSWPMPAR